MKQKISEKFSRAFPLPVTSSFKEYLKRKCAPSIANHFLPQVSPLYFGFSAHELIHNEVRFIFFRVCPWKSPPRAFSKGSHVVLYQGRVVDDTQPITGILRVRYACSSSHHCIVLSWNHFGWLIYAVNYFLIQFRVCRSNQIFNTMNESRVVLINCSWKTIIKYD